MIEADGCQFLGEVDLSRTGDGIGGNYALRNCLITHPARGGEETPVGELRSCSFIQPLVLAGPQATVSDCILPSIEVMQPGIQIDHCCVHGEKPFLDLAKPGVGCFRANPHFANPDHFDYRLMPTSPCIGKASDGGDIGCRYTPEMIEMLKLTLDLRAKGVIKF
jgi:hypothetical protein